MRHLANAPDLILIKGDGKFWVLLKCSGVYRAHLNDLENIPAFLFIAYIWVQTEPDIIVCHVLMWLYTLARFVHTAVYAYYPVPQPARGICFVVGLLITLYMLISNFVYFADWF